MALIFIECGTSLRSEFATGIQRVVRNIVYEAELVAPKLGHECVNVRFDGRGFELIALKNTAQPATIGARIFAQGTTFYRKIKFLLPTIVHEYILKVVAAAQRLSQLTKDPQQIFKSHIRSYDARNQIVGKHTKPILLLLDSTWDMRVWKQVDEFKATGGHVSAVLYDLIPFTHPETVEKHTRKAHTIWWSAAPLHLDSVICISKTVRKQFIEWQDTTPLARRISSTHVDYFYLGSDLRNGANNSADAVTNADSVNYGLFFLVVGSIEPRKNHTTILDAFELLWLGDCPANLVIVGSHGWMSEDFLARVMSHPMRAKRLFLLRRATDAQLALLYKDTLGLVIASVAEGFGLPIVEAFKHGTQVICSDIPVFREVAGECAAYFEATNPATLAAELLEIYRTPASQLKKGLPKAPAWLTWEESTSCLLGKLSEAQNAIQQ